jgi:hypothetical protein
MAKGAGTIRAPSYDEIQMTSLIKLLFPSLKLVPTVENFGARLEQGEPDGDDSVREEHLVRALDPTIAP